MPVVFESWLSKAPTDVASVQYGSITVTQPATSNTATITSVDTTKSVVIPLGFTCDDNVNAWPPAEAAMAEVVLTNATTVTAKRAGGGSYSIVVNFCVITFNSMKSLQDVTISGSDSTTSNTATITSVDTTKAVVFPRYWAAQNTNAPNWPLTPATAFYKVTLTNATTLTQTRNASAVNRGDTSVTVAEFP